MEPQFKPTPLEDIFREEATPSRPVWYGAPGEPMPLEEILAGAERVTVPELAPTPAENSYANINPIVSNDPLPWHLQPLLNPRPNDTQYTFPTQPFQAESPLLAQADGGRAGYQGAGIDPGLNPGDTDPTNAPTPTFMDGVADGVKSYFRGIGRAGDSVFDMMGATNAQAMEASRRANGVFFDGVEEAITNPGRTVDLIRRMTPSAVDYVGENPGLVTGRLGTGAAFSVVAGPEVGLPLSGIALYGDAIRAIRNGANTEDEIIRAILGGEPPEHP